MRKNPNLPDPFPTGLNLLCNRHLNKGTAFTEKERDALRLRGLLPPRVHTMEEQSMRIMENFHRKTSDLEKYIHMMALRNRNKTLFYRVVMDHLEEMLPILYTPTVGQACLEYGHIYRAPRGVFLSIKERGQMASILRNWPNEDIRLIVVTDGERILGLGDLGAAGMGIPVGKLILYTACAGIDPSILLPITLDVGTNNEALLHDPLYIGLQQPRLHGREYDDFIEEFVGAVNQLYPHALIQLEDFANNNAFRLLRKYRSRTCLFDDDIQGTGSVALAGLYSAMRITGGQLKDQRILLYGAGEAGIGTGEMIVAAIMDQGLSEFEARRQCWFIDSKGLVVSERQDLNEHKVPFAHEAPFLKDLVSAIEFIRPSILIGASGQPGAFDSPVLEAMIRFNERPVIFSLSNPTSKTECTANQAYTCTQGQAIYASGSPFDPFEYKGTTFVPSQGNNAYIFPGVGMGVVACGARHITDEMFYVAAKTLAQQVSDDDLSQGRIYPPLSRIRDVSLQIATEVARIAYRDGLATFPQPDDLEAHIRSQVYEPEYENYA